MLSECGLLIFGVLLSVVFYTARLGFYADDWAVLATLDLADNHSTAALVGQLTRDHRETVTRPLEVLFWVTFYQLFGLQPLGYHIVNALVLISNVLLFYFCLRELQKSRLLTLAIPSLYMTLPHYSTDRFWISATIVSLSMALYFVSLFCDLRALRVFGWRFAAWKASSVGALLGSTFAYETALPLFLINPLLVRFRGKTCRTEPIGKWKTRIALLILYGSNAVNRCIRMPIKDDHRSEISNCPC
jgi:hypothetical protein